jgi:hypothetical protein
LPAERGGLLVGRRRWRVVRLHGEETCSLVVNFEVSLSFVNCTANLQDACDSNS